MIPALSLGGHFLSAAFLRKPGDYHAHIQVLHLHHHRHRRTHHAAWQPEDSDPHAQGKIVGIYCNQPAKILQVETQDWSKWATDPGGKAFLSLIDPQTSVKVVGGQVTSVHHMLAMALDDPSMDEDLRKAVAAHEIVFGGEWADVE